MRVGFQHVFGAGKTILSHGCHLSEPLNLRLLDLKHLLNEADLTLLLNQLPSVFSVLRPLNGNGKTSSLRDIDFALDLWIDGELRWLNVSFTNFPKASFSGRSILLPNPQLLVLFSFDNFSVLFSLLE